MPELAQKRCIPCEGGAKPFTREQAQAYLPQVPEWNLSEDAKSISRKLLFKDFISAIHFIEQVADIAEYEGHHPDIHLSYNRLTLELSTHAIKGLSENDFILAAKVNRLVV